MHRGLGVALACVACVVLGASDPALAKDKDDPVVSGDLGERIDAAVETAGGDDLWGSVLVAKGGEILLAKGYGFADYDDTPNTPRTLFELASASKQFAAAAILHLRQKKKLSLDDTLDEFFDDVPEDKQGIAVRHLLTHTSGISGNIGVPYASPLDTDAYVEKMLAEPLIAEPGETFQYCNVGYALLAAIVESASKTSFEKYLEKHLFKPAKMKDTGFIGDKDLEKSGRTSSRKTKEPGTWTAADWHWGWGYRGMGGVVTTVLDMHRWDRALRGDQILDEASKADLHTPALEGYACGWRVEPTDRGTRKAHHSGSVAGYGTNVVRFLEDDALIVVLSNDGRTAYEVTAAVEKLLFEPVRIEAVIDTQGYDRGARRIVDLPAELTWKGVRKKKGLVLQLADGKKRTVVEVRAPRTYGQKLLTALEQAIAAREVDDDGGEPAFEGGLYLQAYDPGSPKIELSEDVRMEIRPEYRGRDASGPVVDKRILVTLETSQGWPFMLKMNVAAARTMLAALRKAMK